MTVRGTLKADGLTVARINIDFLQNPVKVHALAALVMTQGGQTLGWTEGDAGTFSPETMEKLQELRLAMEQDLAKRAFVEQAAVSGATQRGNQGIDMGGLGEHVGTSVDAPSI